MKLRFRILSVRSSIKECINETKES